MKSSWGFKRNKDSNSDASSPLETQHVDGIPRGHQILGRSKTTPLPDIAVYDNTAAFHAGECANNMVSPMPQAWSASPAPVSATIYQFPDTVAPTQPAPSSNDELILNTASQYMRNLAELIYAAEETAATQQHPVLEMTDIAATSLNLCQDLVKAVTSLRVPGSLLSSPHRTASDKLALSCKDMRKRKDEFERQAKKVRELVTKMNSVSAREEMNAIKDSTMAMVFLRERADNMVACAEIVVQCKAEVVFLNSQPAPLVSSSTMPLPRSHGRASSDLPLPSFIPPRSSSLERNGDDSGGPPSSTGLSVLGLRPRAATDLGRGRDNTVKDTGLLHLGPEREKKRSISPMPGLNTLKGMLRRPSVPNVDAATQPSSARSETDSFPAVSSSPFSGGFFMRRPSAPAIVHKHMSTKSDASDHSNSRPREGGDDSDSDSDSDSSLLSDPQQEDNVDDSDVGNHPQNSAEAGLERHVTDDPTNHDADAETQAAAARTAGDKSTTPSPTRESEEAASSNDEHSLLEDSDDEYIDSEEERERILAASKVRKASKFLGMDEEDIQEAQVTIITEREWFLNYDYGSKDVTINMEGDVTGATVDALIERLTIHDSMPDLNLCKAFFLCFRCFVNPVVLAEKLEARFRIQPPDGLVEGPLALWRERKQTPIQTNVISALRSWLENYWIPDTDDDALEDILEFLQHDDLEEFPGTEGLLDLVERRMELDADDPTKPKLASLRSRKEASEKMLGLSDSVPSTFKVPANPIDIDPVEIANQLTLMDSRLFNAITSRELVGQEWSRKKGSLAVNVRAMSTLATQITTWVQEMILFEEDIKKRVSTIKFFLKVADRCLVVNNYDTLFAIMTGLNISNVQRLKKSWKLLQPKYMALLEKLQASSDYSRNYAAYRQTLKTLSPPCLPFMGVYLTDLTFIDDGNSGVRRTSDVDRVMINFGKYLQTVRLLNDILRFQVDDAYKLPDNPNLQLAIKRWVENSFTGGDENKLYEQSLKAEPRGS